MASLELLEQQQRERREQYDLLSKKIGQLRKAYAIENDVEASFKQEHRITDLENEREKLSQEIATLEQQIKSNYETLDKYESPKHYLEYQIHNSYQVLRGVDTVPTTQKQTTEKSEDPIVSKYREALGLYLAAYFRLCANLNLAPSDHIKEIADTLGGPTVYNLTKDDAGASALFTTLENSRIINVGVSQLFRIADLLTRPESVKARKFYEALTIKDRARRALNRKSEFKLGQLGTLKPVISSADEYDWFWAPAKPNFASPTTQTLHFIPYELTLTEHLKSLHSEFESVLESALISYSESIINSQISGHLHIYPAGIGVISLGLTLEFVAGVHVEVVAQIAKNIEELLFVDPQGIKRPYDALMLDIVDQVTKHLFTREAFEDYERRWRPPSTTFSFRDDKGLTPGDNVDELAYLMSLAPANHENFQDLKFRVERALRLPHWTSEHTLAISGEGVGVFFVGQCSGKRTKNLLKWLSQTHELVSAAAYARQAFAEEIEKIYDQRLLDDSWFEAESEKLKYLESLLGTMQQVMRAMVSVRKHLDDLKVGSLIRYARDVWTYSNPVNRESLTNGLTYIKDWLVQNQKRESTATMERLLEIVLSLIEIPPPFPEKHKTSTTTTDSPYQEKLEERLLDQLLEIEKMLGKGELEGDESDRHYQLFEQLRLQLNI